MDLQEYFFLSFLFIYLFNMEKYDLDQKTLEKKGGEMALF